MDAGGLELIALTAPHTESILQGVHAPWRNKLEDLRPEQRSSIMTWTGALFGNGGGGVSGEES